MFNYRDCKHVETMSSRYGLFLWKKAGLSGYLVNDENNGFLLLIKLQSLFS